MGYERLYSRNLGHESNMMLSLYASDSNPHTSVLLTSSSRPRQAYTYAELIKHYKV